MTTQISWVYAQLKRGRTLTPILAMEGCGTMRLAAIIYALRENGVNIRTTIAKSKNGTGYATYKLVK